MSATSETRRWRAHLWLAFCVLGCGTPPPLPGYEPDPELTAAAADPSRVVELPRHPGVRAPVDLALMSLREGEPTATAERLAASSSGTVVGGIPELGIFQLRLPTRSLEDLDAALATLRADPAVEVAGYDLVMEPRDCPAAMDVALFDPPVSCPWDTTNLREATTVVEELETPLATVTVGLVDSGIARRNGEFDQVRLIDARATGGRPNGLEDTRGHGTQVAGVIAADDGDGGLNGFASRILGDQLRLVVAPTALREEPIVLATQVMVESQRAIHAGASIVNWSLGAGPLLTFELDDNAHAARALLRQLALNRSNVLFVAAAANEAYEVTDWNDLPAGIALPNVITVSSHLGCMTTERAASSGYGPRVEIAAQGEGIAVVGVDDGSVWGAGFGTSFAAPQVTSLAAVLAAIDPTLSAAQLKQRILDGAQLGPPSTSERALDFARPILELLRDQGPDPVIDADDDGYADRTGAVIARLCGGSTYSVDGFGSHTYPEETEDGVVVSGNLIESGFGIVLQRNGSDSLAIICEDCAFELGPFPISMDGPVTVAYTRGPPASGRGGTGVAGTWTLEACTIVDRYPEFFSSDDTPMTVLLTSSASGEMEAGDGSTEEPLVVGFRGTFQVPAIVEMLPPDHALIQAIESTCEGGRAR